MEKVFKICKNLTDNINKSAVQMMLPAMFNHFQKAHIAHRESRRSDEELGSILKVQKLNNYVFEPSPIIYQLDLDQNLR